MSKCSIKGCKRGATTRIKLHSKDNSGKTKPVCQSCYEHWSVGIQPRVDCITPLPLKTKTVL